MLVLLTVTFYSRATIEEVSTERLTAPLFNESFNAVTALSGEGTSEALLKITTKSTTTDPELAKKWSTSRYNALQKKTGK